MSGTVKAHCNRCGGERNQDVLFAVKYTNSDDLRGYPFEELVETLKCLGCEKVTTRVTTFLSEQENDAYIIQYPPRMARRTPDWIEFPNNIPGGVVDLMYEVYTAVQNRLPRLAAMGIRAALETLIIDKVGDHKTFVRNLDAFQAAGYLSLRQRNSLEAVFDAGHASIHRGWEPKDRDIETLLDITESIVESVYVHEDLASDLEKSVPPRRRPKN